MNPQQPGCLPPSLVLKTHSYNPDKVAGGEEALTALWATPTTRQRTVAAVIGKHIFNKNKLYYYC